MKRYFDTFYKLFSDVTKSYGLYFIEKITGLNLDGYSLEILDNESLGVSKVKHAD